MHAPRGLIAAVLLTAAAVSVVFAASLVLSAGSLGAASISTPRCGTAGLGVVQNLSAGTIVSVTVSGLPSTCGNATLQVAVNTGTANATGSATVPAGGGSVTVTLSSAPTVATSEATDLVLLGP